MSQAVRTLTAADIEGLFAFDADGWSVTCEADMDQQVVLGQILLDGEIVGDFCRAWDEQGRIMRHVSFGLCSAGSRRGFASRWIPTCLDAYRAAGFEHCIVWARGSGRAVWAHLGFNVDRPEWERIIGEIDVRMQAALASGQLSEGDVALWTADREELLAGKPEVSLLDAIELEPGRSALSLIDWMGHIQL
jgi:hypothetical protein